MAKILIILVCLNIMVQASGQNYIIKNYTVEDGLSSNLVKTLIQDEKGFIWIGTDAGIIRFDGELFKEMAKGNSHSYVKFLYKKSADELYFLYDMGFGSISLSDYGYSYKNIINGTITGSDTLLFYPKSLLADINDNLWIGESNGISRYQRGKLNKYPLVNSGNHWDRSFKFVKDKNGNLFVFTFGGEVYKYKADTDVFEVLHTKNKEFVNISDVVFYKGNIYCGFMNGLGKFNYNKNDNSYSIQSLNNVSNVSVIVPDSTGTFYLGTWNDGIYEYNLSTSSLNKIEGISNTPINWASLDKTGNLWVASNAGLWFVSKSKFDNLDMTGYFNKINYSGQFNDYIAFIQEKNDSVITFSNQHQIFSISVNDRSKNFQTLGSFPNLYNYHATEDGYWLSYISLLLQKIDNNGKVLVSTSSRGRIPRMEETDKKEFWGYQEYVHSILRMFPDGTKKEYKIDFNKIQHLNVLKKFNGNDIYFAGKGKNSFLYKFDYKNDKFINLSARLNEEYDINVFDMDISSDNSILLASNNGLYRMSADYSKLELFNIPELVENMIKAVKIDKNGSTWVGTEKGLFLLENNDFIYFTKKDGLANSSITYQGLVFDKYNRIWIANANDVTFWQSTDSKITKTSIPKLLSVIFTSEGKKVESENNIFPTGASIRAEFSTLLYPSDKTSYMYRFIGLDTNWITQYSNSLNMPLHKAGRYVLQIKAKKAGYFWSDIAEYEFEVTDPWYLSLSMRIFYFISLVVFVIIIVDRINKIRINRLESRRQELEQIVAIRTGELLKEKETTEKYLRDKEILLDESEKSRKELQEANDLKEKLLNIAAHDLKNPLQVILGYEFLVREEFTLEGEHLSMMDKIFLSSKRMLNIITELLESAATASQRIELKKTDSNLASLIENIVHHNIARAEQKKQHIKIDLDESINANVDQFWFKEAIDNLISNAVKYSPLNETILIKLEKLNGVTRISVKDNGPGFSDEDKKNMFNKFQRLSAKPTANESSTGLGLFIVKEIIDKHGGKISLETEPGKGAMFIIEFNN